MKATLAIKDTTVEFARSAEAFSKDLAKAIADGIKDGSLPGVQMLNNTVELIENSVRQPAPAFAKK